MSRRVESLTPFVPAKDFDLSLRFYKNLGFSVVASIKDAVRLERDGHGFWLQDYYVEDWAGNFMFCLYVDDLEAWWSHIKTMRVDQAYGGAAHILAEPHAQEGGRMMQLADPAGVLWHIRQTSPRDAAHVVLPAASCGWRQPRDSAVSRLKR
jgi:catechol 2,3-dioxygenase-like lactoylglutathione lyase family enzyme